MCAVGAGVTGVRYGPDRRDDHRGLARAAAATSALQVGEGAVGGAAAVHLGQVPVFVTTVTPRTTAQFRNQQGDTTFSVGYKAGAGLGFQVVSNLMVFVEYRYTHADVSVDLRDSASLKQTPFSLNLDTHSAVMGLSARW